MEFQSPCTYRDARLRRLAWSPWPLDLPADCASETRSEWEPCDTADEWRVAAKCTHTQTDIYIHTGFHMVSPIHWSIASSELRPSEVCPRKSTFPELGLTLWDCENNTRINQQENAITPAKPLKQVKRKTSVGVLSIRSSLTSHGPRGDKLVSSEMRLSNPGQTSHEGQSTPR